MLYFLWPIDVINLNIFKNIKLLCILGWSWCIILLIFHSKFYPLD